MSAAECHRGPGGHARRRTPLNTIDAHVLPQETFWYGGGLAIAGEENTLERVVETCWWNVWMAPEQVVAEAEHTATAVAVNSPPPHGSGRRGSRNLKPVCPTTVHESQEAGHQSLVTPDLEGMAPSWTPTAPLLP